MKELLVFMLRTMKDYYGNGHFLLLTIISLCILLVKGKEMRKRLVYPILFVILFILNPIAYKILFKRIIYWRMFWMIPNSIIIALSVTVLIRDKKRIIEKLITIILGVIVIVILGTNMYQYGGFVFIENLEKLSDGTKEICEVMLGKENNPRCIVPQTLFTEVRQYSGDIDMFYGRDVQGYIIDYTDEQMRVYQQIESMTPDYEFVVYEAYNRGYNFIVVYEDKPIQSYILDYYKYEMLEQKEGYIIYYNKQI